MKKAIFGLTSGIGIGAALLYPAYAQMGGAPKAQATSKLFAAPNAVSTCTPTGTNKVCVFEKSATSTGIRILITSPEVKCMEMLYRGPGDRFDVKKGLTPVYPITEISHGTSAKGLYTFRINYQTRDKRTGSCPYPFNSGGGAAQFTRK